MGTCVDGFVVSLFLGNSAHAHGFHTSVHTCKYQMRYHTSKFRGGVRCDLHNGMLFRVHCPWGGWELGLGFGVRVCVSLLHDDVVSLFGCGQRMAWEGKADGESTRLRVSLRH